MSALTKNLMPAPVERVSEYGLPATAAFMVLQGKDGIQRLIIFYDGDHADFPTTIPNGSIYFRNTAGSCVVGIKNGTVGLTDGSWVHQAMAT
jgi:hypothetical protein